MSKPIKQLIRKEIAGRLGDINEVAIVSVIGIDGNTNNQLRRDLLAKGIQVSVVKNSLARQAFEDMGIGAAGDLLTGPCAVAFGGESIVDVVREILDRAKKIPALAVKGAYMDGEVFGPERVVELSQYPTRVEAQGRLATAALSPGGKLVGAILGPGSVIAGILKAIEEKHDDAGAAPEAPAAE